MSKTKKRREYVWLSTGMLDDPEILALSDHDYMWMLVRAARDGEQNIFSKYIKPAHPDDGEQPAR